MKMPILYKTALIAAGVVLSSPAAFSRDADTPTVSASAANTSMVYVDEELRPEPTVLPNSSIELTSNNFISSALQKSLDDHESDWATLPQFDLTYTETLRRGDSGEEVAKLRERLGLSATDSFDRELSDRIVQYRLAHGLPKGKKADKALIASLNRGGEYYRSLIEANVARARELPSDLGERFLLVDTASQKLHIFENGKRIDTMKVIVGRESDPTPNMAGLIRYSVVNPYWNVPPDLVRDNIAPKFMRQGMPYFDRTGFEALSGWTVDADILDPKDVDWQAVANGEFDLRVRQRPGPGNGMGEIKFMLPNDLGIYLHDTPSRPLFKEDVRAFSSGCVRLEDAWKVAKWLYGEKPEPDVKGAEQAIMLAEPVPVYITYFTVMTDGKSIEFRDDLYGRDENAIIALRSEEEATS